MTNPLTPIPPLFHALSPKKQLSITRESFALTQLEIARLLHVSQATVSIWERGRYPISKRAIEHLQLIWAIRDAWEILGISRNLVSDLKSFGIAGCLRFVIPVMALQGRKDVN